MKKRMVTRGSKVSMQAMQQWTSGGKLVKVWMQVNDSMGFDATHGSLALKAYQQNLYLEYYY